MVLKLLSTFVSAIARITILLEIKHFKGSNLFLMELIFKNPKIIPL